MPHKHKEGKMRVGRCSAKLRTRRVGYASALQQEKNAFARLPLSVACRLKLDTGCVIYIAASPEVYNDK